MSEILQLPVWAVFVASAARRLGIGQLPNTWTPNNLATSQTPIAAGDSSVKMPADVLDYTLGESESWAQDDRQARARELFDAYGDWQLVLQELRREDGIVD